MRWIASDDPNFPYKPLEVNATSVVHSRGMELLQNPVFNKGTAYSVAERERLGVRGLLPPQVLPVSRQMARVMDRYWHGSDFISPEEIESGGITHEHTRKWLVLSELQVGWLVVVGGGGGGGGGGLLEAALYAFDSSRVDSE